MITDSLKFPLPVKDGDPRAGAICTASTELMENYRAGMPVDSQRRFAVVQDQAGHPMVFSIGTDDGFYLMHRQGSSSTGWTRVDLGATLPIQLPRAQQLAVSQDASGRLRLAVAVTTASSVETGSSRLFVTGDLTNDPSDPTWTSMRGRWIERPAQHPEQVITRLLLGTNDDGKGLASLLAVAEFKREAKHYLIDTRPETTDPAAIWGRYPLPENADHVLDVALGTHVLRGGWTLYTVGDVTELVFTSFPDTGSGQTINIRYPVSRAAACLAAQSRRGPTDLYVGGEGIQLFPGGKQTPTEVVGAQAAPPVKEILVAADATTVSVWALTAKETLAYTHRPVAGGSSPWSTAVTLATEVSQIAALRNRAQQAAEIVAVGNDETLRHFWQDPTSTLWKSEQIALESTGHNVHLHCYATHLRIQHPSQGPLFGAQFGLSASARITVHVNHRTHRLEPGLTVPVTTDESGALTVITPITDLAVPVLTLTAAFLKDPLDVHPAAGLHRKLGGMSGSDLRGATFKFGPDTGKPVLSGSHASQETTDTAAKVFAKMHELALVTDRGKPESSPASVLPTGYAWGYRGSKGDLRYHEGEDARAVLRALEQSVPLIGLLGDVLEQEAAGGGTPVDGLFVHLEQDLVHAVVIIGGKVLRFLLKTAEQVLKLLNEVLKATLGIDLAKILAWLGFLFDWKDILHTHRQLVTFLNSTLDFVGAEAQRLKASLDTGVQRAEEQIKQAQQFPADIGSSTAGQARSKGSSRIPAVEGVLDVADLLFDNPVGNWVQKQLAAALPHEMFGDTPSWMSQLSQAVQSFDQQLFTMELENFAATVTQLQQDIGRISSAEDITVNQMITQIAGDVAVGVLEAVRRLVDAVLDLATDLSGVIREAGNYQIDIPVISALYRLVTDDELTPIDLVALVAAIPLTLATKIATGRRPLPNGLPDLTKQPIGAGSDVSEESAYGADWSIASVTLYTVGTLVGTLLDILQRQASQAKGADDPAGVADVAVKFGAFKAVFELGVMVPSAIPLGEQRPSKDLKWAILAIVIAQPIIDLLMAGCKSQAATTGPTPADPRTPHERLARMEKLSAVVGLVPEIAIFGLEIGITVLDLEQSRNDSTLKFVQHCVRLIGELVEAAAGMGKVTEAESVPVVIALVLLSDFIGVARAANSIAAEEMHYNY